MRRGCHQEHGMLPSGRKHDERRLASKLAVVLCEDNSAWLFHALCYNDVAVQIVQSSAQHRHAANVNRSSV
jgi:hypothetical protein